MRIIILLIILLIPFHIIAQTPVPPGPVSGTWNLSGSPYMVNGEIYIDQGSSLTIEAGVQVRFNGWYKFIVDGSLIAIGTETSKILFTADDISNKWHGIRIIDNNETITLDYCIIEYGLTVLDDGFFPENAGGGICMHDCPDASITISNCEIRHNVSRFGGGIQCDNANAIIDNCLIRNNQSIQRGGGMQLYAVCNPVVKNSTLSYNHSQVDGGAVACDSMCYATFTGNTITHNTSGTHGGGFDFAGTGGIVASKNLIAYNSSKYGGGMAFINSDGEFFTNNTIVYNEATTAGGGMYIYTGCIPSFTSDIIYFNTLNGAPNQAYLAHATTIPSFQYCNVQDSTAGLAGAGGVSFSGIWEGCIDADPLFANPGNDDFTITWDNYPHPDFTMSPCIDAGCPGLPELDGSRCDIGANSFFQQLDIPEALPPDSINNYGFHAAWTSAYGALGYYLDIAIDDEFTNMVYEGIEIVGDTTYFVEGLDGGTQYYYRVRSYNSALTSNCSNTQMVATLSVTIDEQVLTDHASIYPNPFVHSTTLYINLNRPSFISIVVFNSQGQLIEKSEKEFTKGRQQLGWDVEGLPAGIYYFVLHEGEKLYSKKIVLTK